MRAKTEEDNFLSHWFWSHLALPLNGDLVTRSITIYNTAVMCYSGKRAKPHQSAQNIDDQLVLFTSVLTWNPALRAELYFYNSHRNCHHHHKQQAYFSPEMFKVLKFLIVVCCYCCYWNYFLDKVSLYSQKCPQTRNPLASVSWMQGSQACVTTLICVMFIYPTN